MIAQSEAFGRCYRASLILRKESRRRFFFSKKKIEEKKDEKGNSQRKGLVWEMGGNGI